MPLCSGQAQGFQEDREEGYGIMDKKMETTTYIM